MVFELSTPAEAGRCSEANRPRPVAQRRLVASQSSGEEEEEEEEEEESQLDSPGGGGIPDDGVQLEPLHPRTMGREERWENAVEDFESDFCMRETKMHRFPASMEGLGRRYIVPMALAIGPYHRNHDDMNDVKRVAAHHFIAASGHSYEEMHAAVLSVAAQSLYNLYDCSPYTDAFFAHMLLRDGCFLLQYMLMWTARHMLPPSLVYFFDSNHTCITNDIMLLENQLPWVVLQTLRRFRPVDVEGFVAKMGRTLQLRGDDTTEPKEFDFHHGGTFTPPHLLGLLRFYKIGTSSPAATVLEVGEGVLDGPRPPMSKTISAIELAQISIKLTASTTTKFMDMGIKKNLFSGQIFLPPLLLDEIRCRWLVNMAALEVCMDTSTHHGKPAVCAYLAMLAMLMDREEDVHELRSKRLVQGQLTNKDTLDFFKSLVKHISGGPQKTIMMQHIEDYRLKRWIWIKVHRFVYRHIKAILTVLSVISVLVGIFKTLLSLKQQR